MRKCRVHRLCFSFLKLTRSLRRGSPSKRTLIIAILCLINLFWGFFKVGHLEQHWRKRSNEEQKRHVIGEHHLDGQQPDTFDLQTPASLGVPTRFNVVYITLKFKRLQPAHIRGTVRPKLRKKLRSKMIYPSITQSKRFSVGDTGKLNRSTPLQTSWKEHSPVEFSKKSYNDGIDSRISTIRIYNQKAPSWFSAQDVKSMRFLADAKVLRMKEISRLDAPSLLIFEGVDMGPLVSQKHLKRNNVCGGRCGIIHSPVDHTEVFAFHLDRVLGLNRTIPAVSRKFGFLHDGQACQVVLWDASLYPEDLAAGPATVRITWREYQNSLTQECWHRNVSPRSDSGCSSIYHSEWSKLAVFDFLLQIHNRLDPSCCGFRPGQEIVCVEPGHHATCKDQENLQLANIVQREHDLRHLVFTNNKGFFDRDEDNLDFRLLEGIKELPEQAVSVLRNRKLREKLLQSLFLDQIYWESQGGRRGIDKLIDIIEKRAKVLLAYINAHGIKVIPMND